MSAPSARRVALFGPFGWGNMGDAAIQESMMFNLRRRWPEVEYVGVSLRPENTLEIHGIASVAIFWPWREAHPRDTEAATARAGSAQSAPFGGGAEPSGLAHSIKRALGPLMHIAREAKFMTRIVRFLRGVDLLVISGGGQLSDEWGGAWEHPLSQLRWLLAARLAGTKSLVVSVGAGPFVHPRAEAVLRSAMRLAHYRSYRDQGSLDLVKSWGYTTRDRVVADLAFSFPQGRLPEAAVHQEFVVGLSPMCYCYPRDGAWPVKDRDRYENYRDRVAEFGQHLLDSGHAVTMFSSAIKNDRSGFDDVIAVFKDRGLLPGSSRLEAESTRDLDHLLSQIASCDVTVVSRLHGVILSYVSGKPVIALSYDPKVSAVMEQFGQSQYCLDIDTATVDTMKERLAHLRSNLDAERARIELTVCSHRALLEQQYDGLFGLVGGSL